ncbi:MAG: hypothetical protein K6T78_04845 [Alicyclobacillus sp.]|nr:hypothetical protein [Alicyclobacillus sp.]
MTQSSSRNAARLTGGLPDALVFREWRLYRWSYTLAAVLVFLQAGGRVLGWWVAGRAPEAVARPILADQLVSPNAIVNGSGAVTFAGAVAVLVAASLMWREHRSGALLYTLNGPVRRRDLLRVRAVMGGLWMVGAELAAWLVLASAAVSTGHAGWLLPLFILCVARALLAVAAWVTGLAVGSACGGIVASVVGAFLVLRVPNMVASLVSFLTSSAFTGRPLDVAPDRTVLVAASVLRQLSPLDGLYFAGAVSDARLSGVATAVAFCVWFLAWVFGFWRLAAWLFDRVPLERLTETFYFPQLWYVVRALVSLLVGDLVGHAVSRMVNGWVFLLWFAIGFIACWLVLRAWTVRRARLSNRDSRRLRPQL